MRQYITNITLVLSLLFGHSSNAQIITTIAGTGSLAFCCDGGPATAASFYLPQPVAVDRWGNVYTGENAHVRKIDAFGIINTIAGTGTFGFSGDGGPATAANVQAPNDIVIDNIGNVYIKLGQRVRKIDVAGVINTVAGTGSIGYSGDGGPATLAQFNGAYCIAVDDTGNLYISDVTNRRIRKVNSSGIINTIVGNGIFGYTGDGGPASAAQIFSPAGIAFDRHGNLYFSDVGSYRIRKIDAVTGIISTIAGSGPVYPATGTYTGAGGPATAATFLNANGLAIDDIGNIYAAGTNLNIVHKISVSGIITTIAGTGVAGFSGDSGAATLATFRVPNDVAIDDTGNVYIVDVNNNRLRKISSGNHLPLFTAGHVQYIGLCVDSSISLDPLLGITDADAGQPLSWVLFDAPLHGTATAAFSSTTTGGAVATTGLLYTPSPGYVSNDTMRIRVDDGISADFTTIYVTVDSGANAGSISGTDTVCPGDTLLLTATATGGTWSSSSTATATVSSTGVVTGVAAGTTVITYIVSNSCNAAIAVHTVTVMTSSDCPTGVRTQSISAGMRIWPNPFNNEVNVYIPSLITTETAVVTITDVTGRTIKNMTIPTNTDIRVILNIEPGIYIISATTTSGQWVARLLVQQ